MQKVGHVKARKYCITSYIVKKNIILYNNFTLALQTLVY